MGRATARRAAMTPATAATSAAAAMTRAAATTSAAAAVACCKSQASAKRGLAFSVEDVEGRQADIRDFLLSENNSRAVSCDGKFVVGTVADAPPAMARENPAAPSTKAAFPRFRLEPRFACAMVEPPCQSFDEWTRAAVFTPTAWP